jgi:hypothetical protein
MLLLEGCGSPKTPIGMTKVPFNQSGGGSSYPTIPQDAPGIATVTPDPINNPIIISDVIHAGGDLETIVIRNISDKAQDINGYSLLNPNTEESINIFSVELAPGGTFNIYNGSKAKDQTDGLAWRETPMLVETGDDVYLLNHAGRLIAHYAYYP